MQQLAHLLVGCQRNGTTVTGEQEGYLSTTLQLLSARMNLHPIVETAHGPDQCVLCAHVLLLSTVCSPGVIREEKGTLDTRQWPLVIAMMRNSDKSCKLSADTLCWSAADRAACRRAHLFPHRSPCMYEPKFSSFIDNLIEIHEMKAGLVNTISNKYHRSQSALTTFPWA